MIITDFPTGIAEGRAFCDRVLETRKLVDNITKGRHTVLISPRRYGKSSLAKTAIRATHFPHAEIDLFVAIDHLSVEAQFLKGVKELIQKVSDTPEQWFGALRNFFAKSEKKWTIGIRGLSLELTPEHSKDIAMNILDALNALEDILSKKNQRAVFFIDEFQEISELREAKAIEGAIRHFAQESKFLVFIFSGSNRRILSNLFTDRSRPLYLLCDRIQLERIAPQDYHHHINMIQQKHGRKPLDLKTLQMISGLTECHPYYINILCDRLFSNSSKKFSEDDVQACWLGYVHEQRTETRKELTKLGVAQLKILVTIACGINRGLTRNECQQNLKLTSSAITHALKTLEEQDYIEKCPNNSYRLINPLLKTSLQWYYRDYLPIEQTAAAVT